MSRTTISFQIDNCTLTALDEMVTTSQCRSDILRQVLGDYVTGHKSVNELLQEVLHKLDTREVKGNVRRT